MMANKHLVANTPSRLLNELMAELVEHINTWGAAQREAGRQEEAARIIHLTHERDMARKAATEAVARAGAAEAALASRPAIDLAAWRDLYSMLRAVIDTPIARREITGEYPDEARRLLREFNEALLAQGGQPANCAQCHGEGMVTTELNERHACTSCQDIGDDSAAPAPGELPPLPEPIMGLWSEGIRKAWADGMQAYARQARADALEEAALIAIKNGSDVVAVAIRALNKKGGAT